MLTRQIRQALFTRQARMFSSMPISMISTDKLSALVAEGNVTTLDCTGGDSKEGFANGHIPNAKWVGWTLRDFKTQPQLEYHKLASQYLDKALAGHQPGTPIVLYDCSGRQVFGFRVGWLLKALKKVAPDADVHVLDGGFAKWTAENKPTNTVDIESLEAVKYEGGEHKEFDATKFRFLDEIQAYEAKDGTKPYILLDARPPKDYEKGHVEGAINLPFTKFISKSEEGIKTMKPKEERAEIFKAANLDPASVAKNEIVAMCQTGVTATVLLAAISDLYKDFGFTNLALYDGSWGEYGKTKKKAE